MEGLAALIAANCTATGPGVVVTAHPASAQAAASALAAGGNAVDAALAACFMDHVALPMKCGMAGDLVAMVSRRGGPWEALVSVGPGALALGEGARLAPTGPASVGVPGAPDGYAALSQLGRLPLATLVGPAVRAASDGIAWDRVSLSYLHEARALLARHSPDNPYAPLGRMPEIGEIRRLPGLGALLEAFVTFGAGLFQSSIGEAVVARLAQQGGFLRMADFAARPARWASAEAVDLGAGRVLSVPPAPTNGPLLAEALLRSRSGSLHLAEAVAEVREAARRRGRLGVDAGTTAVTCVDRDGTAAVVLHSNSWPQFASGVVMPDGLILNNRPGRGFDSDAPLGAPAAPAPGVAPPMTLHCWALDGGPEGRVFGGTPGGVNQLPWNAQMLAGLLAGQSPAEVVCAPRWALDRAGRMSAEPGADVPAGMAPVPVPAFSHRSVQQVVAALGGGLWRAAGDPRCGAVALAVH